MCGQWIRQPHGVNSSAQAVKRLTQSVNFDRDHLWLQTFQGRTSPWCGMLSSMSTKFSRGVVTLVLAICIVCPVIEMFDHWDHTLQTGSDTEYAFVILGLCVGVAYVAGAVLKIKEGSPFKRAGAIYFLPTFFQGLFNLVVAGSISASPPLTTLRI